MEFSIKELIFVITVLASVIGTFEVTRQRLKKIEETNVRTMDALFKKEGGLNVISVHTCKEHRNEIHEKIRHESEATQRAFDEIQCLNQNIIKLMMHMKVEPIIFKKKPRR